MTGSTAALVSFEESSALLHELAGWRSASARCKRAAEALGTEIAADERACVERRGEVAPTMYLGMDGTGVPMRPSEVAGRAGKQPDGSAKTREAKVVTVWTAESRDEEGKPVRDPGSITYSAAIESAAVPDTSPTRSDLAERALREATRRGFTEAPRCAVLGDGSLDLEHGQELFPKPFRSSIATTPKKLCTEPLNRSLAQPARRPNLGHGALYELDEGNCAPSSTRSGLISPPVKRQSVPLHLSQSPSHALSKVPRTGFVHLHRRPGGRMQSGDRDPAQAGRHALDRLWGKRHHRSALHQAQWTLRGFLGTSLTADRDCRVTSSHKSDVHPFRGQRSAIGHDLVRSQISRTGNAWV